MNLLLRLWLAAAFLAAAGCAAQGPLRPATLPTVPEVRARLRARPTLPSFRAIVSVEVRIGARRRDEWILGEEVGQEGGTFAGRAVLLWKAPDSIRLEPLSPFGAPLFVVVASGPSLRAYSAARGRLYVGRADSESMARLLGIPVGSRLMVRIFRGALPALDGEGGERLSWDGEAGSLRLELPPGAGLERRQVAWLDPATGTPRRVRIGEEGASVEVRYGPFRRLGKASVPVWTEIVGPCNESRMRVELSSLEEGAAEAFPDALFELPTPPGSLVVPLEGGISR